MIEKYYMYKCLKCGDLFFIPIGNTEYDKQYETHYCDIDVNGIGILYAQTTVYH